MFCYGLGEVDGSSDGATHAANMAPAQGLGAAGLSGTVVVVGCRNVSPISDDIGAARAFAYEIDGVVFQVDSIAISGSSDSCRGPRWAIASKFPARKELTVVEAVEFQVGAPAHDPVALKPVFVGG